MTVIGLPQERSSATRVVVSVRVDYLTPGLTSTSALQYSDIVGLERSIDTAYQIASQRLFDVFFEKYRLLDHLQALKNYLLLGYGDFVDQLMETLG